MNMSIGPNFVGLPTEQLYF